VTNLEETEDFLRNEILEGLIEVTRETSVE
jgi:hypothetical protein